MNIGKALIFGDSYSTFKGFIPDGYAVYYSEEERPETDVTKVSETWWHQVINEANLNLVLNNSWSGSTIGYTGYNNSDCSKSSSFIYRLKELIENGFFTNNKIDKVFQETEMVLLQCRLVLHTHIHGVPEPFSSIRFWKNYLQ